MRRAQRRPDDTGDSQSGAGERGINLSGGQKQRVSIARAAYGKEPIVLMDDPLSAVDSHVAQHIVDNVIKGMLKGRTVIMTTNQLHFLPRADLVVVMRDGSVAECGTYDKLVSSGLDFAQLMEDFGFHGDDDEDEDDLPSSGASSRRGSKSPEEDVIERAKTRSGIKKSSDSEKGALIKAEQREFGLVSLTMYWRMARVAGLPWALSVMACGLLAAACKIAGDWWLSVWTGREDDQRAAALQSALANLTEAVPMAAPVSLSVADMSLPTSGDSIVPQLRESVHYLYIYLAFGIGEMLLISLVGFLMVFFALSLSERLHNGMLKELLRAPLSFFDSTPIGRITNRFSFDLDLIDFRLPFLLQQFMVLALRAFGVLVVVSFTSYYTVIGSVAIMLVYYFITKYYRNTSIELQSLESLARSPIFAHFNETINGLTSLRAYRQVRGRGGGAAASWGRLVQRSCHANDGRRIAHF